MTTKEQRRRRPFAVLATAALLVGSAAFAQTPAEVNRAIDRGIDYLKSRQLADGSWDDFPQRPGGSTALVTLALLSCDVPATNPKVQKSLEYLRRIPPSDTYTVALQTMVFAEASPKRDFAIIRNNARWLMRTRLPQGNWSYGTIERGQGDNSNTQFALLGLLAAQQAGFEVPLKFWEECRTFWVRSQSNVGSWGYPVSGATGSMTAAGVSSLVITNRQGRGVKAGTVDGKPVACNGPRDDPPLQNALAWMGRNFSVSSNPGGAQIWLYYYLYGMERAGRLTGRRFLGDHDWYRRGARYLTERQQADGSWNPSLAEGSLRIINTAFSLLFLSKGRIPILVNKLKYGPNQDWNNAPNDVNNLTDFLAQQWNVRLNWQTVDARLATVEDLLQAPVLTFSGHFSPRFTEAEKKLLREYVEQGGMILVDANCSCAGFDAGFRRLCQEIFPEPDRALRPIEPGHGVWNSLFNLSDLAGNWPLFGIDMGCRTAVFYSPEDLSCQWELYRTKENQGASLAALRLGANIIAYATGPENLADKLEKRKVFETDKDDEIKRNFLQVAKIRHGGDWNPAPMAIRNLLGSLHDVAKVDVVRQQREIDILDPNFSNYPLAYMHGRNRFSLSSREKEVLADYLKRGGVLFADACCGSERFDESFRQLADGLLPGKRLEPIPPNHELFTRDIGYDIQQVTFTKQLGERAGPPALEGIEIDGRYVVIYSKLDIGCALERQQSTACRGYSHDSALKIATNVVLYALKQ